MSRRGRRRKPIEGLGERLRVELTEMGHQGMSVGHHDGQVVLVSYGIPGELVEAEVTGRHKDYLEARAVQVLRPSPHRVAAPCPYYQECGGCQLQHVSYQHQLTLKREVVMEQLRRIGKFADPPVAPTLGAEDPWGYRNHARFTINKEGGIGFVKKGTHRVIPIEQCLLLDPWINRTIGELRGRCAETRQLAVRYGVNTGEYLIQPRIKNPAVTMETGQRSYHERFGQHSFEVASPSFFQVNTRQAERLVQVAAGYLGGSAAVQAKPATMKMSVRRGSPSPLPSPIEGEGTIPERPRALSPEDGRGRAVLFGELLVDAYAGVGTFAVLLAPAFKRVLALEESPTAVRDGRANAACEPKVEFVEGKVEDVLPGLALRPDAVILDPPRAGCHQAVLEALIATRPARVVYVSCEPATLARDLRILCDGGFTLEEVRPVDMFPQTYHIECVASLRVPEAATPQ